jgi:large subunit ribosomal protein L10
VKAKIYRDKEINELTQAFKDAPNALLVGFQGITVSLDEKLRRDMREAGLTYRVVKNTLAVRAAEGTPLEQLKEKFTGATAIAISPADPVTLAKLVAKWAKDCPSFVFKAGIVEGKLMQPRDLETLSNMPSKEELISKIMFLLNAGAQRIATATTGVARNLAIVIDQVRAQKEA